jgi:hypothetical protein
MSTCVLGNALIEAGVRGDEGLIEAALCGRAKWPISAERRGACFGTLSEELCKAGRFSEGQAIDEWVRIAHIDEWVRTAHIDEWVRIAHIDEWVRTAHIDKWVRTAHIPGLPSGATYDCDLAKWKASVPEVERAKALIMLIAWVDFVGAGLRRQGRGGEGAVRPSAEAAALRAA